MHPSIGSNKIDSWIWYMTIKEVFSLHDEDLGFSDKLAHIIVTTTDKSVYLPHRTFPKQLLRGG